MTKEYIIMICVKSAQISDEAKFVCYEDNEIMARAKIIDINKHLALLNKTNFEAKIFCAI
jgi:hypothetical protein